MGAFRFTWLGLGEWQAMTRAQGRGTMGRVDRTTERLGPSSRSSPPRQPTAEPDENRTGHEHYGRLGDHQGGQQFGPHGAGDVERLSVPNRHVAGTACACSARSGYA
jgi:hypothetical protein